MSNPDWYVDVNPDDQDDYGGDNEPTPDPDGWDDEDDGDD